MKILWLSPHQMSDIQFKDLQSIYGQDCTVTKHSTTIFEYEDIQKDILSSDIVVIAKPIKSQKFFLNIIEDVKIVLVCRTCNTFQEDGTIKYIHDGWDQLNKVVIEFKEI